MAERRKISPLETYRHKSGRIVQIHFIKDGEVFFCLSPDGSRDGVCCRCPLEQAEMDAADADLVEWDEATNDWRVVKEVRHA